MLDEFILKFIGLLTDYQRPLWQQDMASALKKLQPAEKKDILYTREQTQEILNVCSTTLWKYERSGYLMPVRIGKRVFYKQSEIEKAVK